MFQVDCVILPPQMWSLGTDWTRGICTRHFTILSGVFFWGIHFFPALAAIGAPQPELAVWGGCYRSPSALCTEHWWRTLTQWHICTRRHKCIRLWFSLCQTVWNKSTLKIRPVAKTLKLTKHRKKKGPRMETYRHMCDQRSSTKKTKKIQTCVYLCLPFSCCFANLHALNTTMLMCKAK